MKKQLLKKGFTLVELLVVVSIISLISSVVLATVQTAKQKGIASGIVSNVKQYMIAFEQYYNDNGGYPNPLGTAGMMCLGTAGCSPGFTAYTSNATLISNLSPYIKSSPLSTSIYSGPWGSGTQGAYGVVYQCTSAVTGPCTGYILTFVYPSLQACPTGHGTTVNSAPYGTMMYCNYKVGN